MIISLSHFHLPEDSVITRVMSRSSTTAAVPLDFAAQSQTEMLSLTTLASFLAFLFSPFTGGFVLSAFPQWLKRMHHCYDHR